MKFYKVFVCGCLLLLGACTNKGTIYITGEDNAIGAKVYIDGQVIGEMGSEARKNNSEFAIGIFKISNGTHTLMIKNNSGKFLSKRFKLQGENYFGIDFNKNEIQGGE